MALRALDTRYYPEVSNDVFVYNSFISSIEDIVAFVLDCNKESDGNLGEKMTRSYEQ